MEVTTIASMAQLFQSTGPWAIVVVLGWACWRQSGILLEVTRAGTQAIEKSTAAIGDLREALERWREDDQRRAR